MTGLGVNTLPWRLFFFTDIQQSYGGERRGTNFTSRSLSLLKSSAATESAVCEDSLLLKTCQEWLSEVQADQAGWGKVRTPREVNYNSSSQTKCRESAECHKTDDIRPCREIQGWIFPFRSSECCVPATNARPSDLSQTRNKLNFVTEHSEQSSSAKPILGRLNEVLCYKWTVGEMDWCKFTDVSLLFFSLLRGGFEQDVENGYRQHPDTCHGEMETFIYFTDLHKQ